MKTVWVKYFFTEEEWEEAKKHYSDKEIRQILYEGGNGELSALTTEREQDAKTLEELPRNPR